MIRTGTFACLIAGVALTAGGCSQQRVAESPREYGDLRQADLPAQPAMPTLGAADACGSVVWDRGMTSTALLLRPGLPDALAVYDELELEPAVVASVPTQ